MSVPIQSLEIVSYHNRTSQNNIDFYRDTDCSHHKVKGHQIFILQNATNEYNLVAYQDNKNKLRRHVVSKNISEEDLISLVLKRREANSISEASGAHRQPRPLSVNNPSNRDATLDRRAVKSMPNISRMQYPDNNTSDVHNAAKMVATFKEQASSPLENTASPAAMAHAKFVQFGHSPEEYAFHEKIRELEKKIEESKDTAEKTEIGKLIDVLLDLDAKVQEKSSSNFNNKVQAKISTQPNPTKKTIYASVNDELKTVLATVPEKFLSAIHTAKNSIKDRINNFTKLFKSLNITQQNRPPLNNLYCHFQIGSLNKQQNKTALDKNSVLIK